MDNQHQIYVSLTHDAFRLIKYAVQDCSGCVCILLLFRDYTRPELPSGDSEAGATGATGLPDITAALAGTYCTVQ